MNTEILTQLGVMVAAVTPLVTGIVQMIKQIPVLKDRTWAHQLLSVGAGLVLCGGATLLVPPPVTGYAVLGWWLFSGVMSGLGAAGLYSVVHKATAS